MPRPKPGRHDALLRSTGLTALVAGYILLIAYGSLFPLSGWRSPMQPLLAFLWTPANGPLSLSDIDVNILAYIPLGVLLALRLRGRVGGFPGLLLATLLGAGLSLGMETLQNYLPSRVPSRLDLATNTLGTALGAVTALLIGPGTLLGGVIRRVRDAWLQPGRFSEVAFLVACIGVFSLLGPLAPAMEPALRDSSIIPLWQLPFGSVHVEPIPVLMYGIKVLVLGGLLVGVAMPRPRRLWALAVLFGVIMVVKFVAAVLLFKIPPLMWQVSLKALLGLGLGFVLLPLLWRMPRALLSYFSVVALAGVWVFESLQPGSGGGMATGEFSWIPFQAQMNGVAGMLDVLAAVVPYLVAGYAINLVTPYHRRQLAFALGLLGSVMLSAGIEWAQMDIPGRTADMTDILLAAMGWVASWFWHVSSRGVATHQTERTDSVALDKRAVWPALFSLAALLAAAGGLIWLADRPIELPLSAKQVQPYPAPEDMPPVDLPNFRMRHPRLPAPTPAEIERLQRENPGYFEQQEGLAKAGQLYAAILLARVFPGSQNLDDLHRRVMGLDIHFRGNNAELVALAYDWLYDQWSEAQRKSLRDKVSDGTDFIIALIRNDRLSPYNVYLYNSPFQRLMMAAIALYKDDPRGEPAMRFTYDLWKRRMLPVWRQIMGKHGGWHEGGEYIALGIGQAVYQLPALWRNATGEDVFKTEPGIRGFMDFILYRLRPDGNHYRIGDANFGERIAQDLVPMALEFRDAAAYSVRQQNPRPAPTMWPWGPLTDASLYDPTAVKARPLTWLMDGIGIFVGRSSWEPDATYVTFKAGDNYWSHSHLDQGSFTIFKGAPLAIDSGLYGAGYGSDHHMNYTYQTIAHNAITVTDPDDNVILHTKKGERAIANDGGQRRIGSGWGIEPAPMTLTEWMAKREIYHTGTILSYRERDGVSMLVSDVTPAYTNRYSGFGTFSHRTRRVEQLRRTFVYDRVNDVVVIFDRVVATKESFRKRWLLHTLEQPEILPGGFVVHAAPNPAQHQTGGRLRAYVLLPEQARIEAVGGKGAEFLVDGVNYDEGGRMWHGIRGESDPEIGAWRIEVSPAQNNRADSFLTVLFPSVMPVAEPGVRLLRDGEKVGCEISGPVRTVAFYFDQDSGAVSMH